MVFLVLHENSHSHGACQLRRTKSEQTSVLKKMYWQQQILKLKRD